MKGKETLKKTVFIAINRDKINFINRNNRKSVKVKAGNLKQFCLEIKEETGNRKPSPLVGEGVNRQVDGRGKCENKRKNRNSVSKTLKNSFNLCTHTYPFRLAKLGTSLRIRGEADIKEEKIHVFIIYKYAFSISLCRILR